MDFIKRLLGGKPANSAPAPANTGATAPQLPASAPNAGAVVGGKRNRRQTRRNRKHSRKNARKNERK